MARRRRLRAAGQALGDDRRACDLDQPRADLLGRAARSGARPRRLPLNALVARIDAERIEARRIAAQPRQRDPPVWLFERALGRPSSRRRASARQQHPRLGGDLGEHRRGRDRRRRGRARPAGGTARCARPGSSTHCSTAASGSLALRRRRGNRAAAARNRGPGRRSAAAPTGRAPGSGWRRSAPSRGRAPRRAWCRRGSARSRRLPSCWPSAAMPNAPLSSNSRTIRRTMSSAAPSADQPVAPRRRPRCATSARISRSSTAASSLSRPGLEQCRRISPSLVVADGAAQDVGNVRAGAPRAAWSNSSSRTASGSVGRVDLAPTSLSHVEQPLGGDEGGGDLAERRRLPPRSARRATLMPEPVDEAVGDLGGDDLVAQPVRADRVAHARLLHRLAGRRRTAAARASDRRRAAAASIAACSAIFDVDSSTASSGRVRPRSSWRAAQQLLAAVEALDRAVEPAAVLEHLDRPDAAAAAPAAPPRSAIDSASVCRRLSSSTSSATSSVISASSALRLPRAQPALAHLAVERDLDVDLVVRAVDAGANCR